MGVNADEILEESSRGIKQLDQLPDNDKTRKYMDRWLEAKAKMPAARQRVRMEENKNKTLARQTPEERKAREKAEAVRRARKLARKRAQREGLLPKT
jgi:hypothetical protein